MKNFDWCIPTRMIFGKGTHLQTGRILKEYGFQKVLVHYGGGSAVKSGLLDTVLHSLEEENINYVTLGGVQANPTLAMAKKGIQICREEGIQCILAVGGGSVIDSAKCIGDGVGNPEEDVWKFFLREATPKKALPVGVILTLSASGSEMSQSCVITNEEGGFKRGFNSPTHRPLFSICNPELTYTVGKFQTGCGIVDILMHTLERYLAKTQDTPVTDRLAEGLMASVIEAGRTAFAEPDNYEARAALMWAGSLSHNDLTGLGREYVMQVHQLEHELSGIYPQVAHAAGLSAIFPSWARYVSPANPMRFAQLAVRVWGESMDFEHPEKTALRGIQRFEEFFQSLDMPVRLGQLDVEISEEDIKVMAEKCTFFGKRTLDGIRVLDQPEMEDIYRLAMKEM